MSAEFVRDNLFKPFQSTKRKGMGIGAYESYQYVHELGGRIVVESTLRVGTRFRVLLPLHNSSEVGDDRTRQAAA
jgi:signal transduction histidine kinase